MTNKRVLFIINPISGTGNKLKVEHLIKTKCEGMLNFDIKYTEAPLHGKQIAAEAKTQYDAVVAVGGDGTINEIAQSLIDSDCHMGIIPLGSGNGLARHLKIPLNTEKAIENIINFNSSIIDTGSINDQFFVNVAGVGFDAFVAHKFAEAKGRGFRTYAHIITKEFPKYKPLRINLEVDNTIITNTFFMITIANSSQFGNNAFISPNASLCDGLFNVVMLRKFPLITSPVLAGLLFTKKIDLFQYVQNITGKKIVIEKKGEICAQIDGEPVTFTDKIVIENKALSLKIITPEKYNDKL